MKPSRWAPGGEEGLDLPLQEPTACTAARRVIALFLWTWATRSGGGGGAGGCGVAICGIIVLVSWVSTL